MPDDADQLRHPLLTVPPNEGIAPDGTCCRAAIDPRRRGRGRRESRDDDRVTRRASDAGRLSVT